MRVEVQPASDGVLHLYGPFSVDAPALLYRLSGIGAAYLISEGRSADKLCLVVHPNIKVSHESGAVLLELVYAITDTLGFGRDAVCFTRPVERQNAGQVVTTPSDWLRLSEAAG